MCLCDPRSLSSALGVLWLVPECKRGFSFYSNIPCFLLKHPSSSGPAVPDMTQIAIFSTASALNHTSVWWKCHHHTLCMLVESHLPYVSPSSGRIGSHLCFHRKWGRGLTLLMWVTEWSGSRAETWCPAVLRARANWGEKNNPDLHFFPTKVQWLWSVFSPLHHELTFCTDILSVTWKNTSFPK